MGAMMSAGRPEPRRYVYGIADMYGRLVYVGVGKGRRCDHHLAQARRGVVGKSNQAKGRYLIDCLYTGMALTVVKIAENLTIEAACALEIDIIELLGRRDLGTGPLFNACAGGNGVKDLAPATIAKIAARALEQNKSAEFIAKRVEASRTPEARAKVSAAMRLRMSTPEARAKSAELARKVNTGRVHSPALRQKMSLIRRGRKKTAEHVEKIAAANRGQKRTDESRAKMVAGHVGNTGCKHSPEARARIAESVSRSWAGRRAAKQERTMKTFWMVAELGSANIKTLVQSDKLDGLIEWWEEALTKQPDPDHRQASRSVVVEALEKNLHHTDQKVAEMVCGALLWLTVKGPVGQNVLPFMRRGDMTVIHEITKQQGKQYRFRTRFDEKTDKLLAL